MAADNITKSGIRRLPPHVRIGELFGIEEREAKREKPSVVIARILAVGQQTQRVVTVFQVREIRDGKKADRRPAWAMPGGKTREGGNPFNAVKYYEGGEIPWRMVGEPRLLDTGEVRDRGDRFEQVLIFFVMIDEESTVLTPIPDDPGQEVTKAELRPIDEILAWDEAPMGAQQGPPNADLHEMYRSHKAFYRTAWEKYQEMKAAGKIA